MEKPSLRIAITGSNGFVAKNFRKILNNYKIPSVCLARKNFKNYSLETKVISSHYNENKISATSFTKIGCRLYFPEPGITILPFFI